MSERRWSRTGTALGLGLLLGAAAVSAQEPATSQGRAADEVVPVVLKAVAYRTVSAEVTLVARNAEGAEQELPVVSDQPFQVFLFEPGPWNVRPAPGSGFWGRDVYIDPDLEPADPGVLQAEGDGSEEPAPSVVPVFEVPVFSAVSGSGRVVGPRRPVSEILILLGDVDSERLDPRFSLKGARVRCPVANDGRWSCDLPGTLVHLVFWLPGHSPEYRWETPLFGRRQLRMGDQRLIPGASLAGFVAAGPDFRGLIERCVVHVAKADPTFWMTGLEDVAATVEVARDGFFQAAGLGPGHHWIQVDCGGRVAARAGPWTLERNAETFPRKRVPLMRSHLLEVSVLPADPPYDSHWVARLKQIEPEDPAGFWRQYRPGDYPQQRAVVENGRALFHVPGNGAFSVEIADEAGGRFGGLDYLEIVADRAAVVELDLVPVVGRLTLDDVPVTGLVFFGGRQTSPDLTFRTDADGWFRGALPGREGWRVDVVAPEYELFQFFHDIDVPGDEPLVLELADTAIQGRVLSASTGRPAERAIVRFESADGQLVHQATAGEDGSYSARGVPPGWVRISAQRLTLESWEVSDPFETTLHPRQSLTVNLVLRERMR
ncbi:MAG: carboxypeptidase-like regulatory domain-containing protein [Acidobacteriota bacterium]|nr:carboxypeptidase-like regulatory domain-containing protein [Acidobacteriota bacterium]MDE3263777.1 carboxypeptidase-like regulatory domain-containing protein [Acidobacteriota bacterium]